MKAITLYLGETTIELSNSFLGKETITLNGQIVSSKYSVFGTEHIFNAEENGKIVEHKLTTGISPLGVGINLSKDEKPIIETPKRGCGGWVFWAPIHQSCD